MASVLPFRLDAFDKTFRWVGQIDGVLAAELHPRTNAVSVGTFTVASDDSLNYWLQQKGVRVVVTYRGTRVMGGPVRVKTLGLLNGARNVYSLEDDYRIFQNTLAWIVPVATQYSQGFLDARSLTDVAQAVVTQAPAAGTDNGYGAYVFDAGTRTAETAIKEVVRKNLVTRLGRPVTIAADQQRGGDAFTAGKLPVLRFDTLADGLAPLLTWSQLVLSAVQVDGQGLLVDVAAPAAFPQTLTYLSGNVTDGSGTLTPPSATRIVVGGPGQDTARAFLGVTAAQLESDYGDVIEVLRDASGTDMNWASTVAAANQVAKYFPLTTANAAADITAFLTALTTAGNEALTDGQPTNGLSMTLAETTSFHFGGPDGVQLGTPITAQMSPPLYDRLGNKLADPVLLTSPVSGADITLDDENGLQCSTLVGQKVDDPDQDTANAIAAIQLALRRRAQRR